MRADNSRHLHDAVRGRQRRTLDRATSALSELQRTDQPVSVAGLARTAGVTRSWIYTQPDLLDAIRATSNTHARARPAITRSTDESWNQRLTLAHGRIRDLTAENRALRDQLARVHGQLRAYRTANPTTKTPSATQTPSSTPRDTV